MKGNLSFIVWWNWIVFYNYKNTFLVELSFLCLRHAQKLRPFARQHDPTDTEMYFYLFINAWGMICCIWWHRTVTYLGSWGLLSRPLKDKITKLFIVKNPYSYLSLALLSLGRPKKIFLGATKSKNKKKSWRHFNLSREEEEKKKFLFMMIWWLKLWKVRIWQGLSECEWLDFRR